MVADEAMDMAIHEAGHALITILLGYGPPEINVENANGITSVPTGIPDEHLVLIALGGEQAEILVIGEADERRCSRDVDVAWRCVEALCLEDPEDDGEYLDDRRNEVRTLLAGSLDDLLRIATRLRAAGRLNGPEVEALGLRAMRP